MTSSPTDLAIEAAGLTKRFGSTVALAGVDLDVRRGAILGLLGPNGAGKTTVVKVLATSTRADAGSALICGYDVASQAHQVRQLIGVTGQYASVDGDLTGLQNLVMVGRLLGLSRSLARQRARRLLDEAGLESAADKAAKTYSGGMRRRLDLAVSLINRPAVVFLDEPTTGLDPVRRSDTWRMIKALAEAGSTVLLTTQYLEEADHLADEIVVIDSGQVAARGTPNELKKRLGRQTLDVQLLDEADADRAVTVVSHALGHEPAVDRPARRLTAAVDDGEAMAQVVRALDEAGIKVNELSLRLPSLDDVFLALVGHRPTTGTASVNSTYSEGDQ